jgi:hypothetical protein
MWSGISGKLIGIVRVDPCVAKYKDRRIQYICEKRDGLRTPRDLLGMCLILRHIFLIDAARFKSSCERIVVDIGIHV